MSPIQRPGAPELGRSLSTHLDVLRFGAALVVLLSHTALQRLTGGLLPETRLVELADDAVMAFFVLSGFLICYTAEKTDRSVRNYAEARLARLYSVALPALFVTVMVDEVGRWLGPATYAGWWRQPWSPFTQIGSAVLFTNELWFHSIRPFSDGPYWSLGYEFWYYVLFAVGFYLRPGLRWIIGALVCAVIGPKILALFPLWLLGVAVYRLRDRVPDSWGWPLFLGSSAGYLVFRLTHLGDLVYWWHDAAVTRLVGTGYSRHIPSKYVVAALVACNILGFAAIRHRVSLRALERPARWLAGMTFSLYLLHFPLLHFFAAVLPGEASSPLRAVCLVALVLLCVIAIASVTERKKRIARQMVDAIGGAVARRLRMA